MGKRVRGYVLGWGGLYVLAALMAAVFMGYAPIGYAQLEAEADAGADLPTPENSAPPLPTRDYSPAEVRLLQELDVQRIQLLRREQALELREKLVDLAEQRLGVKVQDLRELQNKLEGIIQNVSRLEDEELTQLARIYENMKPNEAAEVLDRLDNAIVYDVFKRMQDKKSAKILEQLSLPKARFFSELMAEPKDLPEFMLRELGQ